VTRRAHAPFQILRYHRVNELEGQLFDTVSPATFAEQMELLRRYFTVLSLSDLVERAASDAVPPGAVAITFDDGYQDNYEYAFPILRRLGLPATIFLTTGPMESGTLLWHDRLIDAFQQTRVRSFSLDGRAISLGSRDEIRAAFAVCFPIVRNLEPLRRDEQIRRLARSLEVEDPDERNWRKLNWKEVEEMAANGISFGAHTVTHPILTKVSRAEAFSEIMASREAIERVLGRSPDLFAYPNGGRGDFDDAIKQFLRDAGFRCSVTTLQGANDARTDPHELRREGMWDPVAPRALLRLAWNRFAA
jgi:peptidoglycan/xylan/chitin deacetylase (PgdA/CDA1 family)